MPRPDEGELARLFDEHAGHVWRVLRRLGVEERDVEDVVQEVFLVVHRRLGDYEGRGQFRTWLYGICRRCASAHRRRAYRARETLVDRMPDRSEPASQHGDVARQRAVALLDRVLGQLPDDQREVYVLYELEDLPMREVAEAAGCPLQTAYSRLYAARRAVRAALEALGRSVA